jgi:uncharacterized membrane protein YphA (DoxX/SURF4 family)
MRISPLLLLTLRLIPALIMIQTLYFKFSGSPESIYIFSTLNMEPAGRYLSGIAELIAGILLIFPRFTIYGALLASGVMGGAILSHLTVLGIEVMGDGGLLFALAIVVLLCSVILLILLRKEVMQIALVKKVLRKG